MAVRINLLPYRQIRREERQRQFNAMLAATAVIGVAVVFIGQNYISGRMEYQQERNQRLEQAIAVLDKEIAEIKDLKARISDVLARKQVVENLQNGRNSAIILLDEIARRLPEGTYLKSVKQQGNLITLNGISDTDGRVVTLIRNLADSPWMENPELIEIHAVTEKNLKQSAFTLTVRQKAEQQPEQAEEQRQEP